MTTRKRSFHKKSSNKKENEKTNTETHLSKAKRSNEMIKKTSRKVGSVMRVATLALCISSVFALISVFSFRLDKYTTNTPTQEKRLTSKVDDSAEIPIINDDTHRNEPKQLYSHRYEVLETLPHDMKAFTQGLSFYKGNLYEGTGIKGQSKLRLLDPSDPSNVIKSYSLPYSFFGEGISFFKDQDGNNRIIQITWQEKTGFIYDVDTFEIVKSFNYQTTTGEGWGITYDDVSHEFIVSDGSPYLHFWDRDTLVEKRKIAVKYPNEDISTNERHLHEVNFLNELELIRYKITRDNGKESEVVRILANVWYQDFILSIDPSTGEVEKVYDFTHLHRNRTSREDCFNGIAVSEEDPSILYLTGKLWTKMYKVKISLD